MKTAFAWGAIFGAGIAVILLGHNGILTDCETAWQPSPSRHVVSPRMVYIPGGCQLDWPSHAKICTYTDASGNVIRHTRF